MKICTKCKIEKPFSEFRKKSVHKDGYQYTCKECTDGKKPHSRIIEGLKTCTKCGLAKDIGEFSNLRIKGILYKQPQCKKCKNEYKQNKAKLNPTLESLRKRKQTLRSKYGIEIEQYDKMYSEQNGCCKICNKSYKLLNIDHCHDTLLIRGLLCSNCNTMLGHAKDSIENLESAIRYLKNTDTNK
jgi:vacuolar-type H+-ATPase subunit I/STV1